MAYARPFTADKALASGETYSCHAVETAAAWEYETHEHIGCCDLTYVYSGELEQEVNRTPARVKAGMMTFVRDGDLHSLRSSGMVMFTLNFRTETLLRSAAFLGLEDKAAALIGQTTAPRFVIPPEQRPAFMLEYRRLLYHQRTPMAHLLFQEFIVRWWVQVVCSVQAPELGRVPSWVSQLQDHIEQNVEQPVRVADLSRICGRSAEHIARSFRTHLGITPSGAINRSRVRRAALLLAHTNREIVDICFGLGFSSTSYFYRVFSETYGLPPRRYRLANSPLIPDSVVHSDIRRLK